MELDHLVLRQQGQEHTAAWHPCPHWLHQQILRSQIRGVFGITFLIINSVLCTSRVVLIFQNSFWTWSGKSFQVCGLKWSHDDRELASGGNDNQLLVWNQRSQQPVLRLTKHTAAVKAIAWSPHQHSLVASGGGTADRCIRFWNTANGNMLNSIDTGSQVSYYSSEQDLCDLCFSEFLLLSSLPLPDAGLQSCLV